MSKLETNTIDTVSGTTNLTIGSTNTSTITMPNGALSGQNYPAFYAYLSPSQSVSDNVDTKVQANTELLDTDNCYDNTTNYRFTPNVAGKYLVFGNVAGESNTTNSINSMQTAIYLNGSQFTNPNMTSNGTATRFQQTSMVVVDMNGSSDYVELFGKVNINSGTAEFNVGSKQTFFCAYRLGA